MKKINVKKLYEEYNKLGTIKTSKIYNKSPSWNRYKLKNNGYKLKSKGPEAYFLGFIGCCRFTRKRNSTKPTLSLQVVSSCREFLDEFQKHISNTVYIKNRKIYKYKERNCFEIKYQGNKMTSKIKDYIYIKDMGKYYL